MFIRSISRRTRRRIRSHRGQESTVVGEFCRMMRRRGESHFVSEVSASVKMSGKLLKGVRNLPSAALARGGPVHPGNPRRDNFGAATYLTSFCHSQWTIDSPVYFKTGIRKEHFLIDTLMALLCSALGAFRAQRLTRYGGASTTSHVRFFLGISGLREELLRNFTRRNGFLTLQIHLLPYS